MVNISNSLLVGNKPIQKNSVANSPAKSAFKGQENNSNLLNQLNFLGTQNAAMYKVSFAGKAETAAKILESATQKHDAGKKYDLVDVISSLSTKGINNVTIPADFGREVVFSKKGNEVKLAFQKADSKEVIMAVKGDLDQVKNQGVVFWDGSKTNPSTEVAIKKDGREYRAFAVPGAKMDLDGVEVSMPGKMPNVNMVKEVKDPVRTTEPSGHVKNINIFTAADANAEGIKESISTYFDKGLYEGVKAFEHGDHGLDVNLALPVSGKGSRFYSKTQGSKPGTLTPLDRTFAAINMDVLARMGFEVNADTAKVVHHSTDPTAIGIMGGYYSGFEKGEFKSDEKSPTLFLMGDHVHGLRLDKFAKSFKLADDTLFYMAAQQVKEFDPGFGYMVAEKFTENEIGTKEGVIETFVEKPKSPDLVKGAQLPNGNFVANTNIILAHPKAMHIIEEARNYIKPDKGEFDLSLHATPLIHGLANEDILKEGTNKIDMNKVENLSNEKFKGLVKMIPEAKVNELLDLITMDNGNRMKVKVHVSEGDWSDAGNDTAFIETFQQLAEGKFGNIPGRENAINSIDAKTGVVFESPEVKEACGDLDVEGNIFVRKAV